jgi:hypothetical protein
MSSRQTFSRDLRAAFPEVQTRRSTDDTRFFEGITLLDRLEPPHTAATVPIVTIARAGEEEEEAPSSSSRDRQAEREQCEPSRRCAAVSGGDGSPDLPADLAAELQAIGEEFERTRGEA